MSTLFLRTLREDPADAEVPSHRLLVRAGYVRRAAAGIYSWLPLGKIVLDNVARIVREEMDAMGAQEVLFPALLPREHYDTSGRWDEYGDQLFRLKDRKGNDYLLGPTHEEMFTLLVKGEYASYRDYPVMLYQVQTKYRDEARPRSGILRGREFVMKDSYSFDLDDAGLQRSYEAHRATYIRIFERLGLRFRIVSAMSGAMGGSKSEEFLAPTPIGEDTFVACTSCEYAANVEAVESVVPPVPDVDHPPMAELDTPGTATIESLVAAMGEGATAAMTLKNLLVKIDGQIVAVGVPGDRDVALTQLEAAVAPAPVEIFEAADFAGRPDLVRGYIGPQGLRERAVPYFADRRVARGTSWVTGANKADTHVRNVVAGRDFEVDRYLDVATILPGDTCPRCGGALDIDRAIEIGHIFQLGRKYADAFELDALGADGERIRITMGSYGVGVSRAVASIVEQSHDDKGICWPRSVAPADVHIVPVGKGDEQLAAAETLARDLEAAGLRVLLDDRTLQVGVKFNDADLIGIPLIVVVGKGLAEGNIEVKDRKTGERSIVAIADAVSRLVA
ncbi:MAG: proline--tRNA ligase [Actinomycetota bacterium]